MRALTVHAFWGMGLGPMFSALLRAAGYAREAGMERSGNAMPKQRVTVIRANSTLQATKVLALLNNHVPLVMHLHHQWYI